MDEEKPPPLDSEPKPEPDDAPPPLAEESSKDTWADLKASPSVDGIELGQGSLSPEDEKKFAALGHLLPIVPFVLLFTKAEESPYLKDQMQEAANFQITASVILIVLSAITSAICLFAPVFFIAWVTSIIFLITAALKAKEGVVYRYPFAVRIIK